MSEDDLSLPRNFALLAAVFEGGLAVVAVGLGWLLGQVPLRTFPRTPAGIAWGAGWGLAATVPPLAGLWLCLRCPWRPFAELVRIVDELLAPLFHQCRVIELAAISALAGLGEEMLFRGVIQEAVGQWVGGPTGVWVGLAAAAVLFGLLHRITRTYAVLAGAIGLYLGGIWLATDNLMVPITAHAAYDFLAMVYFVRRRKPPAAAERPPA